MDSDNLLNFNRRPSRTGPPFAAIEGDLSEVEPDAGVNRTVGFLVAIVSSLALWAVIGFAVAAVIGNRPV
jgi:hypothetical protein